MFRPSLLLLQGVTAGVLAAASLKDCRSVFLKPMPEALDEFVGVELLKWGAIRVVTAEDKADCIATFGRQATQTQLKTSGSSLVPADASLEAQSVRGELPASNTWFSDGRKAAALTLIHRGSAEVVWGDSKADGWSWSAGAKALATKLVAQLKKDYAKGF